MASYSFIERTSAYELYARNPDYMPRKSGPGIKNPDFTKQITESSTSAAVCTPGNKQTVNQLNNEQRDALLQKLHNGQGDLSHEDWDSFLLDLVDFGLIDDNDRIRASGSFLAVPSPGKDDAWNTPLRNSSVTDCFDSWNGNPLAWLDRMDLYLLRECKLAEAEGNGNNGLFAQKASCQKVAQIVRSLMNQE